jgi:hypothetical protein
MLELGGELLHAFLRQVEREELDRDGTIANRIVRTEYRPQRAGADLMKNTKAPERVGGYGARRVGVQRGLLQR